MKITLETGKRYKADIRLGFFEAIAPNDIIASKLLDAGFVNVMVFGKGRDRWATGEWGGAMKSADLPGQITRVIELPGGGGGGGGRGGGETLNGIS